LEAGDALEGPVEALEELLGRLLGVGVRGVPRPRGLQAPRVGDLATLPLPHDVAGDVPDVPRDPLQDLAPAPALLALPPERGGRALVEEQALDRGEPLDRGAAPADALGREGGRVTARQELAELARRRVAGIGPEVEALGAEPMRHRAELEVLRVVPRVVGGMEGGAH